MQVTSPDNACFQPSNLLTKSAPLEKLTVDEEQLLVPLVAIADGELSAGCRQVACGRHQAHLAAPCSPRATIRLRHVGVQDVSQFLNLSYPIPSALSSHPVSHLHHPPTPTQNKPKCASMNPSISREAGDNRQVYGFRPQHNEKRDGEPAMRRSHAHSALRVLRAQTTTKSRYRAIHQSGV